MCNASERIGVPFFSLMFSHLSERAFYFMKVYKTETLKAPIFLKMYKFRVNSETENFHYSGRKIVCISYIA